MEQERAWEHMRIRRVASQSGAGPHGRKLGKRSMWGGPAALKAHKQAAGAAQPPNKARQSYDGCICQPASQPAGPSAAFPTPVPIAKARQRAHPARPSVASRVDSTRLRRAWHRMADSSESRLSSRPPGLQAVKKGAASRADLLGPAEWGDVCAGEWRQWQARRRMQAGLVLPCRGQSGHRPAVPEPPPML